MSLDITNIKALVKECLSIIQTATGKDNEITKTSTNITTDCTENKTSIFLFFTTSYINLNDCTKNHIIIGIICKRYCKSGYS